MKVNSGKDVAEEYRSSLADLTINSKPLINMLTMLAEDYIEHAPVIVKVVELHLQKVSSDVKLPVLYLIDSIVKNVGKTYVHLFTQNIVSTFCTVFEKVDEKVRSQMFKLRQTWNDVFPAKKLFALDVRVHSIDPAWPITAAHSGPQQAVRIHVNPKFLQGHAPSSSGSQSSPDSAQPLNDGMMREELLKQQKELLELQKRKVELELLQTKAILEEQQKKLENQAASFITDTALNLLHSDNTENQQQPQADVEVTSEISYPNQGHSGSLVTSTNSNAKSYKSSGSSFRTRDPRIKYRKDKSSEGRSKSCPSHKESKKEKKNYKRHKERLNTSSTTSELPSSSSARIQSNNEWNKKLESKESSSSSKKRTERFGRDLHTKLSSEELPSSGVDVISLISTSNTDDSADVVDTVKGRKKARFQSFPAVSCSNEVTDKFSVKQSISESPPSIYTSVSTVSENTTGNNVSESKSSDAAYCGASTITGIKRIHSRSPSPYAPESAEKSVSLISDQDEPPKKKSASVDMRFTPDRCDDDIVGTIASKDVDLRLLPSSTKGLSDDPHSTNVQIKITRTEMIDTLFGEEDVDLRTLPPIVGSPEETTGAVYSNDQAVPPEKVSPNLDNTPPRSKSPCNVAHGSSDSSEITLSPLYVTPPKSSNNSYSSPSTSMIYKLSSDSSPLGNINSQIITIDSPTSSTLTQSGVADNNTFNSPPVSLTPPYISAKQSSNGSECSPIKSNAKVSHRPQPQFHSPNHSPVHTIHSTTVSSAEPDISSTSQPTSTSFSCSPSLDMSPHIVALKNEMRLPILLPDLPNIPSPPPPPIISKDDTTVESSWANYKRTKGEDGEKKTPDNLRRSNSSKKERTPSCLFPGIIEEKETDQDSEERSSENCNIIIKEAEQQLSNGNITFSQYNRMLKEVIAINEERKLQEALRKDQSSEQEDLGSDSLADENVESSSSDEKDDNQQHSDSDNEYSSQDGANLSKVGSNLNIPGHGQRKDYHLKSRKRRTFYSAEGPYWCNNPGRGRGMSQKQVWENRNTSPNRVLGKGGRSKWFGKRGHPPPVGPPVGHTPSTQLLPRCKTKNFPVWMGPSAPAGGYYDTYSSNFRYGPPISLKKHFVPRHIGPRRQDLPPADPLVLEMIEKDCVRSVKIDDAIRELSYYGETAIMMIGWDDPREVTFQEGTRILILDDEDKFLLQFNAPYRDCIIDGHLFKIRLGAPTRELFIDGMYYEVLFGGPSISIKLGGHVRKIQLTGPMPKVRLGTVPRTDLVAGKINLIVDAKQMFPVYLDAKPQRFEVGGIPYILRFVEALQTVVINGVPFKFEFGGVPVPIYFHGEKHFLRLSVLPRGIRPGYISIVNMEGGRLPSPPPERNVILTAGHPGHSSGGSQFQQQLKNVSAAGNEHPLELLTSLMPTSVTTLTVPSYSIEMNPSDSSVPTYSGEDTFGNINVGELFQKLVASGIVPPVGQNESSTSEDTTAIKLVDFSKPETLKVRQPGLITRLYSGIQCSSCGVRFPPEQTVKYSQHLDWHFRQNRREKMSSRIARSRRWNYDVSDWIQFQEIEDIDDRAPSWFQMQEKSKDSEVETEEEPSVAAIAGKLDDDFCQVCHDTLETFYNEEKEEWHIKQAVRVDGVLYHPDCYKDVLENRARIEAPDSPSSDEDEPIIIDDIEPNVCINDLDIVQKLENVITYDKVDTSDDNVVEVKNLEEYENTEEIDKVEVIEMLDEKESTVDENLVIEDKKSHVSDDGDVEIVAVSTEPDLSDSAISCFKEQEKESNTIDHESDDDILQIEVVERKIESYEIIDDDDDDDDDDSENIKYNQLPSSSDQRFSKRKIISSEEEELDLDEEIHFTIAKVKKEKIDLVLPDPVTIPSHVSVVSTIDGNVELDEATPVVVPRNKIKINISSKHIPQSRTVPTDSSHNEAVIEPLPPGEELVPATLKSRLLGQKMEIRETVVKGNDISSLCSIM